MKLKRLSLPIIALLIIGMTSCQKDNEFPEEDSVDAVTSKVQHKWKIQSIATNVRFAGIDNQTTYTGSPDEYIDFRPDGNMYTYFRATYDTSSYSVVSDKYIAIGGDQSTIRELTDHSLILFSRDNTDAFGYFEVTYNLSR